MKQFFVGIMGFGLWLLAFATPAMDYVIGVIDPTRIVEQSPQ